MISLRIPGSIEYRDIAVRVVGGACKLVDVADQDQFANEVVSAFSEAFNNVVLHGYAGVERGEIEVRMTLRPAADGAPGELHVALVDTGRVFDPGQYLQLPDEMPERGMGLFIIRSFVDELRYQAGPPNVLLLVKRFGAVNGTPPPHQPPPEPSS